jgi:hypothetical protein
MYSGTIHWCLWRCGRHHTTTTTTTTTTIGINFSGISNTVPCFKEILWKYLTVLGHSKMFFVLKFELILIIGSNNVLMEGARKVYRGRRVGQGWSNALTTVLLRAPYVVIVLWIVPRGTLCQIVKYIHWALEHTFGLCGFCRLCLRLRAALLHVGFHCLSLHVSAYMAIFRCVGVFVYLRLLLRCLFFSWSRSAYFSSVGCVKLLYNKQRSKILKYMKINIWRILHTWRWPYGPKHLVKDSGNQNTIKLHDRRKHNLQNPLNNTVQQDAKM